MIPVLDQSQKQTRTLQPDLKAWEKTGEAEAAIAAVGDRNKLFASAYAESQENLVVACLLTALRPRHRGERGMERVRSIDVNMSPV